MKKITKAVFPVAGMGSRFLPATKASPKEMMPIVDKPLIQYAVEEAVAAGITDMVFITGRNKRAIEDHFDKAYELEAELAMRGKEALLRVVREVIPAHINCIYIRQTDPLGLGHAVLCARPVVQDEPFAVILADDLIDGTPPIVKQMVDVFQQHQCSILGVQNVPRDQTRQYGIVSSTPLQTDLEQVNGIVEKPKPEDAPSTLAVVGRYILTPRIFHHLEKVQAGAGGEIQLTDGIAALMQEEKMLAYRFKGTRYDCGSKLGYLQAMVALGLKHPEVRDEFAAYLDSFEMTISIQRARDILQQAELLCSHEQVQAALRKVAQQINTALADKHPLLLSVMGGAVVFSGQLLPLLNFPLDFDYVDVSRYGDARHGGAMHWKVSPRENVRGRVVLLLDDILDEGRTLAALHERVLELGAMKCYSAVFADKQHGRKKPIHADFVGMDLPNRFVFGYGMDVEGAWRNLPAIYAIKEG